VDNVEKALNTFAADMISV